MTIKIQPNDINARRHFYDAFNNHETEISARWIVRFCQERGRGWEPFPLTELEQFYNERGFTNFWFNRLLESGNGVRLEDGTVYIEQEFIARCWKASPVEAESEGEQ